MGTLAPFLADLASGRPPRWPPGALLAAWRACQDVDEMIALLSAGVAINVFERAETTTWEKDGLVARWLFRLRHAGRFYRIDVRREDGAEGVRRCFPDFPDDWPSSRSAQRDEMSPLDRLLSDLRNGDPISVPRDDAQRAWERHDVVFTMLEIIRLSGHPMPDVPPSSGKGGGMAEYEAVKRRTLDAIRAAYPRVPIG